MFPHLQSKEGLESRIDWAMTFWAAAAGALPNNPWRVLTKTERKQQREESIVGAAIVFQALGLIEQHPVSMAESKFVRTYIPQVAFSFQLCI